MRKTSVHLEAEQVEQLRRKAEWEGRSQADVLRDAIRVYAIEAVRTRDFACDGGADGPGGSVAHVPEEELLKGFGE